MKEADSSSLIVEILSDRGLVRQRPLQLRAHQVVVRLPDGTPVALASSYGPDGAYLVSCVHDAQFNKELRQAGVFQTVEVEAYQPPAPEGGSRLVLP